MLSATRVCRGLGPRAVPARCISGPRGSLVSARRASVLGAVTPDPAVGGKRTKPRWLDCEAYREARRPLQRAVKEAKRRAWGELLASLDADPCGRPYKMVLNKLRLWASPTTESMDPRFLEEVVGTLFLGATDEENSRFTNEEEQEPQSSKEEPRDPRGVGARNRESPRKNWSRLSGGSEHGKLRAPTESRLACGRTSLGSWPRD